MVKFFHFQDEFEAPMSEFNDVEDAVSNIGVAYRCKPCQFNTESVTKITEHIQQHRVCFSTLNTFFLCKLFDVLFLV